MHNEGVRCAASTTNALSWAAAAGGCWTSPTHTCLFVSDKVLLHFPSFPVKPLPSCLPIWWWWSDSVAVHRQTVAGQFMRGSGRNYCTGAVGTVRRRPASVIIATTDCVVPNWERGKNMVLVFTARFRGLAHAMAPVYLNVKSQMGMTHAAV